MAAATAATASTGIPVTPGAPRAPRAMSPEATFRGRCRMPGEAPSMVKRTRFPQPGPVGDARLGRPRFRPVRAPGPSGLAVPPRARIGAPEGSARPGQRIIAEGGRPNIGRHGASPLIVTGTWRNASQRGRPRSRLAGRASVRGEPLDAVWLVAEPGRHPQRRFIVLECARRGSIAPRLLRTPGAGPQRASRSRCPARESAARARKTS